FLELHVAQRRGKCPLRLGKEMLPECKTSADRVLPEARLRLVQAERSRFTHGCAVRGRIETLFVEAVANLMQDAEKPIVEAAALEACREPAIAGTNGGKERMRGRVEPPALEIKTERCGYLFAECALPVKRKVALQDRAIRAASGVRDGSDQRHQLAAKRLEQAGDVPAPGVGLIFVEERVVWAI